MPRTTHLDTSRLHEVIALQSAIAAAAVDLDEIMALVADRAAALTEADAGVVEMAEGDEMVYRAVSGTACGYLGMRLRVATSLSGRAVREAAVQRCDDAETDERVDRAAARKVGARSMLCVPLCHDGAPVGVLKVYADRPRAFGDADVALLDSLSGVIAAHMSHAAEYERRWFESRHDALTDLGNRRAYDERLHKEVARAARYRHPLALILLDLNHFKAVNDADGHPAGDEVLRAVGRALQRVRRTDDCFRIGGDEFALLLPDTPDAGGRIVAARVTDEIAVAALGGGRITASAGVAAWDGHDAESLHAAADADLLAVKRARRSG